MLTWTREPTFGDEKRWRGNQAKKVWRPSREKNKSSNDP